MQNYWIEFATLMAVFGLATISPGADFAMVLRQSVVYGRKNAIITAFGIGAALMIHVTYTVLGLGLVISKSVLLFNIIKWLGVSYLMVIGIMALKAKGIHVQVAKHNSAVRPQSAKTAFLLGFIINLANPKAVLFFLSIFTTLVAPTTPLAITLGYGAGMTIMLISWFVAVSVFMTTPIMRQLFSRASKWVDRICGAAFIALGIRLMFQKATQ